MNEQRSRPRKLRDAVFWFDRKAPPLPALEGALDTDVVVVGGGMMGLMCARTLRARGQRVCLVEAETCGAGASGRSSGLITPDSELELRDLVRQFGPEEAPRLWDFALGGVKAIRQAIVEDQIDCDMQVQDALFVAATAWRSRGDLRGVRCPEYLWLPEHVLFAREPAFHPGFASLLWRAPFRRHLQHRRLSRLRRVTARTA